MFIQHTLFFAYLSFFIHIVDMDLSLNESETNMMVTEEKIVSVTSLPALLKPGNIL